MGIGTMIGTWLAAASLMQGPPADAKYMNQREFKFPIEAPPNVRAEVKQFFLWVSTNEGKTWEQSSVASPTDKEFPFTARGDGVYWFAVSSMDKNDRRIPADVSTLPPDERVVVVIDTRKPLVRLHSGERQAGQISVAWEVQDENLDINTLALEYRTSESPTWYAVPVSPATASGQKRWPASAAGPIMVRLKVNDRADNVGSAQTELPEEPTSGGTFRTAFAPPTVPPGPAAPAAPAGPIRPAPAAAAAPANESPFPSHSWNQAPPPATRPLMHSTVSRLNMNGSPQAPAAEATPVVPAPIVPPPVDSGPRPIASSDEHAHGGSLPGAYSGASPTNAPSRPRGSTQGVVFINRTHVDVNYEVSRKGPSGLGAVELWRTLNEGRTWQKFAEDRDREPPFSVDLPSEGYYDLMLVVRSGAGLGKQAPNPGEAPEMRLEVDTTPPVARLWTPKADPSRRDMLILVWTAEDRNFGPNPVSLQWSERPGGPWKTIEANLPNTGNYNWNMPADLPYQVYLKLEVGDLAGNVSSAETKEPVLVDLSEPEGKLTGIVAPAPQPGKKQ